MTDTLQQVMDFAPEGAMEPMERMEQMKRFEFVL